MQERGKEKQTKGEDRGAEAGTLFYIYPLTKHTMKTYNQDKQNRQEAYDASLDLLKFFTT